MTHIISDSPTAVNSASRLSLHGRVDCNVQMKTNDEIRLENLLTLIAEAGSIEDLAERYECTAPYIKQMARGYKDSKSGTPKGIGDSSARQLERCMNKQRGWMDHDHELDVSPPWGDRTTVEVVRMMRASDDIGRAMALAAVKVALAGHHPARKSKRCPVIDLHEFRKLRMRQ